MLELRKRADKTGKTPAEGEAWPLSHVELVGKAPKQHNFADTFVARALADGYLSFTGAQGNSEIVLSLKGRKLRYKVIEPPGRYPDKNEESGERVSHEYRCKLVTG